MKLTRHNLMNVAIAAAALILFAGFVLLSSKGDNKKNDLATVGTTTSTVERTTSTTERATTTTSAPLTTTSLLTTATTTARTTTSTQKKTTASTTVKTTTTIAHPSGRQTEHSDNTASFTHGQDGSFSVSKTDPPAGSDPLRFTIATAPGGDGVSGDTASVKFSVTFTNNTNQAIAFPDGTISITVTMHTSGGSDVTFTMTATNQTPLGAGDSLTISQTRGVSGYGTFEASATCDVDYG